VLSFPIKKAKEREQKEKEEAEIKKTKEREQKEKEEKEAEIKKVKEKPIAYTKWEKCLKKDRMHTLTCITQTLFFTFNYLELNKFSYMNFLSNISFIHISFFVIELLLKNSK
jgi:ATP-dependent 26S proteasome regulatory subunit